MKKVILSFAVVLTSISFSQAQLLRTSINSLGAQVGSQVGVVATGTQATVGSGSTLLNASVNNLGAQVGNLLGTTATGTNTTVGGSVGLGSNQTG